MNRRKAEYLMLILTALCLAFFLGYYLGTSSSGTLRINTTPIPPSTTQTADPNAADGTEDIAFLPAATEAAPTEAQLLIDLNTATMDELMLLDGVGEKTAQNILSYREQHGGFTDISQLLEVSGIGEKKYAAIRDHVTVSAPQG